MTAQVIDGNALSRQLRAEVAQRAAALTARGHQPGLAVILVGDDPASAVYVRNKVKACEDSGVRSVFEKYDASLTEAALLDRIAALNADPACTGYIVQLPLPKGIDENRILGLIDPAKDADGLHPTNLGRLVLGTPAPLPCTPRPVASCSLCVVSVPKPTATSSSMGDFLSRCASALPTAHAG